MTAEHEARCLQCGRCCEFTAIDTQGVRRRTGKFCPYLCEPDRLDGKRRCRVYPVRASVPWCVTLERAIAQHTPPNDCPYVQGIEGYRCNVEG